MSVVVLGMEMPDNCSECNLLADFWCYAKPPTGQPGPISIEHRPDWCPLRPLPEKHGDLVDRQAMMTDAIRLSGPTYTGDGWSNAEVYTIINRQKTVIEAEGGNDE